MVPPDVRFKAKMYQIRFPLGVWGSLQRSPDLLYLRGLLLRGGREKGRKGKRKRVGKGRGGEGRGALAPHLESLDPPVAPIVRL